MPAFTSCAQSQNLMPASGNRSVIGIMAEPMMPKACSIPCIWRILTNASSVVIFMAFSPGRLSLELGRSGAAVLEDHVAGLLADHDRGRIGVAADDRRHDGGVGDAQPVDPVDAQPL